MLTRSGVQQKNTDHGNGARFSFLFADLCEISVEQEAYIIEALIYAGVLASATTSEKP